ncbi:hypothetical protein PoB_003132800 [Plakobranchus ocellatus]|uniref:Uncharacterized protein n=1 Tax=Plakobranchus ocellatus TaxID=259542 RepID=A0AAV4AC23_9GAST|nr:hypothetical protein PoB_003132800 [Plakobranchus ocellatus]
MAKLTNFLRFTCTALFAHSGFCAHARARWRMPGPPIEMVSDLFSVCLHETTDPWTQQCRNQPLSGSFLEFPVSFKDTAGNKMIGERHSVQASGQRTGRVVLKPGKISCVSCWRLPEGKVGQEMCVLCGVWHRCGSAGSPGLCGIISAH